MKDNPLCQEKILELFALNKEKNKLLKRESVTLEFKESFNFGSMVMYFKTIASFANRNGRIYYIWSKRQAKRTDWIK